VREATSVKGEQIRLVQQCFESLRDSEDTAALFYECLFHLNPELDDLLSGEVREHERKFLYMLGLAVKGLSSSKVFLPGSAGVELAPAYRVEDHDYYKVCDALLWALGRSLGPAFTPELRAAWVAAYHCNLNYLIDAAVSA